MTQLLEETNTELTPSRAINPETGEIDWDCPCLAEALKPPCGEVFKTAFSCFVKSVTEPKGEDCMSLFVEMQKCYLAHPEVYAPEEDLSEIDSNSEISQKLD